MAYGNEFVVDNVKYRKGKKIGSGGNGVVFKLNQFDGVAKNKFVIKLLKNNFGSEQVNERRKKRFKKEIETVLSVQGKVKGILPIIQSKQDDEDIWYIMPKAKPCMETIQECKDIQSKIEILLQVANTIKELHQRELYHRDIKPDNILFLGDKPYLSDFGLVFNGVDDRNTDEGESVGPYLIRPPELEAETAKMTEFSKSDVYLFAKTLWMIIVEDNRGFRGPYTRKYGIYLKKERYRVRTFEPLHRLMESATVNEYEKRITIEQCITYLKEQLAVITNESDNIEQLEFEENIKEISNNIEPSEISYVDAGVIHSILKSTGTKIVMMFSEEVVKEKICLKYIDISGKKEDRIFIFRNDIGQDVIMRIEKITVKQDKYLVIITGELERQEACESISLMGRGMFVKTSGKYAVYRATEIDCAKI